MPRYTFLFDKFDMKTKKAHPSMASFEADEDMEVYGIVRWFVVELSKKNQVLIRCVVLKDADEAAIGKLLASCNCIKAIFDRLRLKQPAPIFVNPSFSFSKLAYVYDKYKKVPATPEDITKQIRVLVENKGGSFVFSVPQRVPIAAIAYDPQEKNEFEIQFGYLTESPYSSNLCLNTVMRVPINTFDNEETAFVWFEKVTKATEEMYGKQLFLYSIPENQKK